MKKKKKNKEISTTSFVNKPFSSLDKVKNKTEDIIQNNNSKHLETTKSETDSTLQDELTFEELLKQTEPLERKLAQKKHVAISKTDILTDDELVIKQLDELVYGQREFDIADTDEYIEASISGLNKKILQKLRKGEYAVQDHIDLHGLNRIEARETVALFINKSCQKQKKCVLIIHGRGLRSQHNIPVLKEKLRAWLTRGAMGKKVLAYTSARPHDGGTGAVYVLLRS